MQIVIELSDETYDKVINPHNWYDPNSAIKDIVKAIENGIPLPKGHGRLIDVGQCDRELFYQQCGGADSLITVKSAFDMLMSLPPIIEADKEQDNGNDD